MSLNFSGMILAAGFGKRMMPLTKDKPKPLIKINGVTLLDNAINFLIKLGCNEIIINTHYKHLQIKNSILKKKYKNTIKIIYEKNILDTGGGVKNAIPHFNNKNIVVVNSDTYWQDNNLADAQSLFKLYIRNKSINLLLSRNIKSFGLIRDFGDFIIKNGQLFRSKKTDEIIFYSGLQILNIDVLNKFKLKKFSFNEVWDYSICQNNLYGNIMKSNFYHVGDLNGLKEAKNLGT